MATGNFRLRTNSELNTIYYRVKNGRECDFEIALSNFKCPKDRWGRKQEILTTDIVDYNSINKKLKEINSHILGLINNDVENKIAYSREWLKNEVFSFLERYDKLDIEHYKIYILDFFKHFKLHILPLEKGLDGYSSLSQQTKKNFNSAYAKYDKFEKEYVQEKLLFSNFDDDVLEEYKSFLINNDKLAISTVNKYIKTLLSVLVTAHKQGYLKNMPTYKAISKKSTEDKEPYLSFEELDKIISLDLKGYLDNARDWLVIGCETGLRVSDLLRLNMDFISKDCINIKTMKTKEVVTIPLSVRVQSILSKNNGFPRKYHRRSLMSTLKKYAKKQKLMKLLKEVN